MNRISESLEKYGVSPTPIRIMVYRCLDTSATPLSLSEIEMFLDSVDKSTVSRTLALFRKRHLVHCFNDGSGSMKYELCRTPHDFGEDMHVHFHCEKCGKTECLSSVKIPSVDIPEGYLSHTSNFVITGICPGCNGPLKNRL